MLYTTAKIALCLAGADAFQAGMMMPLRAVPAASAAVTMQVAEAEVASPVALAKVRANASPSHAQEPLRARALFISLLLSACGVVVWTW